VRILNTELHQKFFYEFSNGNAKGRTYGSMSTNVSSAYQDKCVVMNGYWWKPQSRWQHVSGFHRSTI